MKKLRLLFSALALLLCSTSLLAHDFEVDGIYYKITSNKDLTVEVTCQGTSGGSYSNEYAFEVIIPNYVDYNNKTYSVIGIGAYAFYYCEFLTSVTVPSSVTNIGDYAFSNCTNLMFVNIPDNVTGIGNAAFEYCTKLTSLSIPNSVTNIGSSAFFGCSKLNSIVIPNNVTRIGSTAFWGCSSMTSITIGNNVVEIGSNAFYEVKLRTAVLLNPEPPMGCGISSTYTYNHATLYIPEGSYWAYAYAEGWGKIIHIKEMAMADEALASSKAYMIADAKGCNYTVYDAGKDELVNVEYTFALDEENEGACWTVMKDGGKSYLYNIGARKFAAMNEDGKLSLSDAPVNLDIATTESGLSINGNVRMFVLNDKVDVDVTAINGITADGIDGADAPVYNLQGMKMQNADNLPKGIYIKNGKKYLVK